MQDVYYQVGSRKFLNKIQAAECAAQTGQDIKFYLYDSAFDQADWTQEPTATWNELLDQRAKQIASKNQPIMLNFSGGTDSLTIYKVFERNNIPIDVLYMRRRTDPVQQFFYTQVFEFFDKIRETNKDIKIIVDDQDERQTLSEIYSNEDWMWTTHERPTFNMWGGGVISVKKVTQLLGKEVISILGFEKPRLLFLPGGRVGSWQLDEMYSRVMGPWGSECFYISPDLPELHIKQCYMLKNHLKNKFNLTEYTQDLEQANSHHNPDKFDHLEYSYASGRFGDIGHSDLQHVIFQRTALIVPGTENYTHAHLQGLNSTMFNELKSTAIVKNYINGLLSIKNSAAGQWLGMSNNLMSMRKIHSKCYEMSF
jgi:hypothetical protein